MANKCYVCGSSDLRADRALAGRLVCTSCGNPYGIKKVGRNKVNKFNLISLNKKYLFFISILIFAFIIVVI
tara:strand:+ start:314 stop:526 length:213 start_codon:yes stop_codon:yes gene_type:complete